MRLVLIVEARADTDTASILADRVFIEGDAEWIDAETLPSLREWTGIEPRTPYTQWMGLGPLAPQHRVRVHGRGLGPDGAAARKALPVVLQAHEQDDDIKAVVLVRDMDNQPERRTSIERARAELTDKLAFHVAIAAPDPKREAWILYGYEPQNERETTLLENERKRLGFDPITNPERLRGDRRRATEQEDRDMKLVVDCLTQGDLDRERQCLETTPLSVLKGRGQETGLADYLGEAATRLLPLLDPGANVGVANGSDT
ncbi:hypothetical protein [Thiocapsa sp.]|uniref:hypothetical protein n=1 Tax=Thiocapsa sp. TaxID=2024551 RepID=UPI002C2101D1|nr:hypothetical protein [Thiocapsa sp.]HSO83128.1 hypothetical protein [Thiocapsa sp.]